MSANVETMAYNLQNGVPWHKSGTPVDGLMTAQEALEAAGLNWNVTKTPIYTDIGGSQVQIPGHFAITRTSDSRPLGVVGARYRPVQNEEAFSFLDELTRTGEAKYETAGALGHGERIWILARIPGSVEVVKNDIIDQYITLYNSHDGSKALGVFMTPIRVVCQNTLNAAVRGASGVFQIRHTHNYRQKMNAARDMLGFASDYYMAFTEAMKTLAARPVDDSTTLAFIDTVMPEPKTAQEGRIESWRDRQSSLHALVETGLGTDLPGVRGTVYGLYQAATEYADHHLSLRTGSLDDAETASRKAESTLFAGTVQKFKQRALDAALALA